MTQINCFSSEVIASLGYYVYRLIDPRNGLTFYVGKGKGNRVFAHINDALKNYHGENYEENDDESISTKTQTIREIKNDGLDVIHVIHRYGLTEKEAFEVESALIDAYSGLTNMQDGHSNDRDATNAYVLQKNLSVSQYEEPADIKYIIIKTRWNTVNLCKEKYPAMNHADCIYEATRSCWVINPERAKKYKYVLGVIDGIVHGVYKVKEWKQVPNSNRYEFFRDEIEEDIVQYFIDKRIPEEYTKKGSSNPIQYCKN